MRDWRKKYKKLLNGTICSDLLLLTFIMLISMGLDVVFHVPGFVTFLGGLLSGVILTILLDEVKKHEKLEKEDNIKHILEKYGKKKHGV